MEEEHQHNQQNRREICPGYLRRSGTYNPIRADISSTRHLGHGKCVEWIKLSGKLFALSFLRKYENPLPNRRRSNYDAGQEIRTGTLEYSDFITIEVLKLTVGERRTGSGRDGRRGILQCRPPTASK